MQTEELTLGIYYHLSGKEPDDTAEKKPHGCFVHHSQNSFQKCYITPEEMRAPRPFSD